MTAALYIHKFTYCDLHDRGHCHRHHQPRHPPINTVSFVYSIDSTSDNDVAPSKVSDSGVGGMESEEDNWMSDAEVRSITT